MPTGPRDVLSQRHVSNFVRALGDTVPPGSRDAALFQLAAADYATGSNGRDLSMDLLNPALYATIAATLGANWVPPSGGQSFVDSLVKGLPSEAFLEAAGARTQATPSPSPRAAAGAQPRPRRAAAGSPHSFAASPFLPTQTGGPGEVPAGRYSRRLDAPPRRLTPAQQAAENRRIYGNPNGPADPSSRSGDNVSDPYISRPRRVNSAEGGTEDVRIPRRRLEPEGPER